MFYFTLGSSIPYFSKFFSSLEIHGSNLGMIFAVGSFLAMAIQPILGYLNDKTKKSKEILVVITLMIVGALFFMTFIHSVYGILILFSIYSMAVFSEFPLMDTVTLSSPHPFGKIRLWGSIGFAAGALVSGKVIELFGEISFLYLGIIVGIITIILILRVPMKIKETHEEEGKVDLKALLQNKKYLIFVGVSMLFLGSNNGHNSYFGIYFNDIGGSMALLGVTIFLMTLSEVPFMGVSTKLINKKGVEFAVTLSIFFLTLRWLLYFLFPTPYVVTGSFLIQGASVGLFFATANLFVRSIVDKSTLGTAITIFMAAGSLGGMFFQYISGILIDKYSSVYIYIFFALLTFVALILMFIGKKIKKGNL